jgi:hypothetical protein
MAKRSRGKGGVNKTQAVKDLLAVNAAATPKEISKELASKGIDASPGYVSTIKSKLKRSRGGRRKGKKGRAGGASDKISINSLIETKKFAEKIGGVGKLKAAIDALSKLG